MSCRYQPNYAGDAMYRGDADWRLEPCLDFTYDIGLGLYGDSPVVPGLVPLDRNIVLACGETITGTRISDTSPHALWRIMGDPVANRAYKARRFNIQIDDEGEANLVLSNVSGFTPYITVNRNLTTYWQGPLVDGVFLFTVETGQTGPMTVEVSTMEKYDQGTFTITLGCPMLYPINGNAGVAEVDWPYLFNTSQASGPTGVDGTTPLTSREFSYFQGDIAEPVVWDISEGALPPGLTLNPSTAVISGTPTVVGTYNFTVRFKKDGVVKGVHDDIIKVVAPVVITNIDDFVTWLAGDHGIYFPSITSTMDGSLHTSDASILVEDFWIWYGKGFAVDYGLRFISSYVGPPTNRRYVTLQIYIVADSAFYIATYQKTDSSSSIAGVYNLVTWFYGNDPPLTLTIA